MSVISRVESNPGSQLKSAVTPWWGYQERRPTTKILETPMSTYRNKCGVRRILQGRVAEDLVWKELGWWKLLSLSASIPRTPHILKQFVYTNISLKSELCIIFVVSFFLFYNFTRPQWVICCPITSYPSRLLNSFTAPLAMLFISDGHEQCPGWRLRPDPPFLVIC